MSALEPKELIVWNFNYFLFGEACCSRAGHGNEDAVSASEREIEERFHGHGRLRARLVWNPGFHWNHT